MYSELELEFGSESEFSILIFRVPNIEMQKLEREEEKKTEIEGWGERARRNGRRGGERAKRNGRRGGGGEGMALRR